MKRIRLTKVRAHPGGVEHPGTLIAVDDAQAEIIVQSGGGFEELEPVPDREVEPESATAPEAPERATTRSRRKGRSDT